MNAMKQRIRSALEQADNPMTATQLMRRAKVRKKQRRLFFSALDSLVDRQEIGKADGKFFSLDKGDYVPAEVVKINATFGFVTPLENGEDDIFIPGRLLLGSMPGDHVLVQVSKSSSGDLEEGKVVEITSMENRPFAATVIEDERGRWVLEPDRYVRFPMGIDRHSKISAKPGDKVLAQVSHRGRSHFQHTAEILQLFGSGTSAAVSAQAILAEQGVPSSFPEDVLVQAEDINNKGIHPNERNTRKDLREQLIFTIDGADTKDIDDAISIERTKNGWQLGVHIADVSYYVLPDSPIDTEAYRRGTSVYYADSVVPMLPPALSNGICSLNPGEDRLAFSALLDIDTKGNLIGYSFHKTIINSALQGVYSEINQLLAQEASPALEEKYRPVMPALWEMKELANTLTTARFARGGIHLSSVESKITVDKDGKAVDVEARTTGESEGFIEEFMLIANQAAAMFGLQKTLPFLFRIHETPNEEKLEGLFLLLDTLGISYPRGENASSAKSLDSILSAVKDTPLEGIINNVMLRTMAKARYSPDNLGHYGLGLDSYSHFTAPIRRYSDLAIHRIMTSLLTGMRRDNIDRRYGEWVGEVANHSSAREIAAQTAERDAEDCYKAEYLSQFVGEEYEGTISGVTGFGAFVQLPNTVEGLVALDDFPKEGGEWTYDEMISFRSSVNNQSLRLGDTVKVQVVRTDVPAGQIDFIFTALPSELS